MILQCPSSWCVFLKMKVSPLIKICFWRAGIPSNKWRTIKDRLLKQAAHSNCGQNRFPGQIPFNFGSKYKEHRFVFDSDGKVIKFNVEDF
jgi:hypothetical protein